MAKKNSTSKYVKLSPIEHILKRPETYVGSTSIEEKEMYVIEDVDLKDVKVVKKTIKYNPAFIKLFDEIIVNASDQAIRTKDSSVNNKVKIIKVTIDKEKVTVENDGQSIPVELHPTENIYNAELIFSNLHTGENYDDDEEKTVGGRNGLGSKLVNVFSKKFIVDTCDGKKKFKQIVKDNMQTIGTPTVKDVEKGSKSYTKITYYPEVSRFGLTEIDEDSISLMIKRCLDVAVYNPKVRVIVNGKTIPVKSVKDYMQMHLPEGEEFFYEKLDNGWEVGIAKSQTEQFEQVSLVNGINTYRGGTHINYVSLQVSKDVTDKFKRGTSATWADVKNRLFMFLISAVPNPEFDTQTKENLTKYISAEIHKGSKVGESTIKKIMKSDIVASILREIEIKEMARLKRQQKANAKVKVEKLVDANNKDRSDCQLFIFEGDSAEAGARKFRDPKTQGMFKLKGKFANTRKMTPKKMVETEEVSGLMSSLGLTLNEKVSEEDLRFNEILITTDMDTDGDSIVGLLLNFFSKWKELFEMKKIYRCITPLLVIKKGKTKKYFYTQKEWEDFQSKNSLSGYDISYKKGLGSLEDEEYKEMIQNPRKVLIEWDEESETFLECWFGNDTEPRKKQLSE
jgi:DNA topoisomerase-2